MIIYRWIVALTIVAMFVGFISWGVDIHTNAVAQERIDAALVEYQAGIQAQMDAEKQKEEAERLSEAHIVDEMATALSRVLAGISKFEDKYGYDEDDYMTLAWCVFNRVDSKMFSNDIYEVINQPDQWVDYVGKSTPIAKYKDIAIKAVMEWRSDNPRPISDDFLWAEQTPSGVYLKNDFNADGYARRWQYR